MRNVSRRVAGGGFMDCGFRLLGGRGFLGLYGTMWEIVGHIPFFNTFLNLVKKKGTK